MQTKAVRKERLALAFAEWFGILDPSPDAIGRLLTLAKAYADSEIGVILRAMERISDRGRRTLNLPELEVVEAVRLMLKHWRSGHRLPARERSDAA